MRAEAVDDKAMNKPKIERSRKPEIGVREKESKREREKRKGRECGTRERTRRGKGEKRKGR